MVWGANDGVDRSPFVRSYPGSIRELAFEDYV